MKRILFITLSFLFTLTMNAQSTKVIKGAVIDKYGNPIPGAQVKVTNGTESTTIDADGTFSLKIPIQSKKITATYPGMKSKKLKVSDNDMIFELKEKHQGFLKALFGSSNHGKK